MFVIVVLIFFRGANIALIFNTDDRDKGKDAENHCYNAVDCDLLCRKFAVTANDYCDEGQNDSNPDGMP